MRDEYGYSAQKLADEYNTSKSEVIKDWAIAELPIGIGSPGNQLTKRHLYEISKMVDATKLLEAFEQGFDAKSATWNENFQFCPASPTRKIPKCYILLAYLNIVETIHKA